MSASNFEATDHAMIIGGERPTADEWSDVPSPYDGESVGRVPKADAAAAERAIAVAKQTYDAGGFDQHERAEALERAARIVAERKDQLAAAIAAEAGKPLKTATAEAQRCEQTLIYSAVEARTLAGEVVPMNGSAAGAGKLGMTIRVPFGVVGAISPFNFPLNLVAHKLGPAIAAGNAVVLKPAGQTPISGILLAEILLEAGVPEGWVNVVTGPGSSVGEAIVTHEDTRALSFTGSAAVGWDIRSRAPRKHVGLELGSNAPLIVMEGGDWETAADKAQIHAFSHAGQSCISIQRMLIHESVVDQFVERLAGNVEKLVVGDPMSDQTDVGPLISPDERDRVKEWIDEAVSAGAELVTGGELVDEGRCLAPTLLRNPSREAKVWCDEIFGPVATISSFSTVDEALEMANDSVFGLQAGVFTPDVATALRAVRELEFGGVLVNEVPTFRADQQPYGGVKDSGNTREGPYYAVRELTEERLITFQAG